MKKLFMIATLILLASCSANTSGNIDIDTKDVRYVKDARTGNCFAFIASRKSFDFNSSGLGFTSVPCKGVK